MEPQLYLDRESHLAQFSESYAIERFGAFWLDSIFSIELPETNEDDEDEEGTNTGGGCEGRKVYLIGVQIGEIPIFFLPEQPVASPPAASSSTTRRESSNIRLLFGPAHSVVSSGLVHRLEKVLFWAYDHQYEPYIVRREEEIREMQVR